MKVPVDKVGEVSGINGKNEEFKFPFSLREVKHIRRCIRLYEYIHPEYDDDDKMTMELLAKFHLFGKRKRRNGKAKRAFQESAPKKCSVQGCNNTDVTFDHIIPLSAGSTSKRDNLQWLCRQHHNLKNYEWILNIKEKECIKLKERINQLKSQSL
jgi:5-methylcytosine-specific restriction endonuclease McrA